MTVCAERDDQRQFEPLTGKCLIDVLDDLDQVAECYEHNNAVVIGPLP